MIKKSIWKKAFPPKTNVSPEKCWERKTAGISVFRGGLHHVDTPEIWHFEPKKSP